MDIKTRVVKQARQARQAAYALAGLSSDAKNKILLSMARAILKEKLAILKANTVDIRKASSSLSRAFLDRLTLNEKRITAMAEGLREVAALSDPIGEVLETSRRPNGLLIKKVRVPLGVVGIIYESRPNVTVDSAGLCLKAGNAVILRGGSEALSSNRMLYRVISRAGEKAGLPAGSIQFIDSADRQAISQLVRLNDCVDVIIPRGGEKMIQAIVSQATVPVIQHGKGLCHTYVDKSAELKMAVEVCYNAKVQRPGVCNAMETLLVHKDIAAKFLPLIVRRYRAAGCEVRGCAVTRALVPGIKAATEKDWSTEYLDLIISVKVVPSLSAAIAHINRYGSRHSDAIIARDRRTAEKFLREVDAAAVYWNASTRFTDGGEFGLGAEIGISTQKLHARGPMGVRELTSAKFVVAGKGQVRT